VAVLTSQRAGFRARELPRPAASPQPVGERRAPGASAPAVPAHQRGPLAGGAHRPRGHGRRGRVRAP